MDKPVSTAQKAYSDNTKVAKNNNQALSPLADVMTISSNVITLKRGDNTTDKVTIPVVDNLNSKFKNNTIVCETR